MICSRFIAPWSGIPEDPVTESAHSVLGAYFAERTGETELDACQYSKRLGHLKLSVAEDTVTVSGNATTVMQGTLLVP